MMNTNRLRFAPSPTGYVHVGNARTALFNFLHAEKTGGVLVLRIEDTDVERSKREYEENLIKDLKWLGIDWHEGPDKDGDFGPYRQSERTETYRQYGQQLIDNGHAYYCFCTPGELNKAKEEAQAQGLQQEYSGKCREIPLEEAKKRVQKGETAAIRFKVPENTEITFYDLVREKVTFDSNLISDPIILRSSGMPAYNFSVVIDDYLMKINIVIRGEDHLSNTARQVLLYRALGFDMPKFAHLSMVMGSDNTKLSKRHGSTSLIQFREEGYLPEALLNYLALLGWSPAGGDKVIFTRSELIKDFNIKKVSKSAAIFDYQKLKWMNREHIRLLEEVELGHRMMPFLKLAGFEFQEEPGIIQWIGKTARVLSAYHYLLSEIAEGFKEFTSLDYDPAIRSTIEGSEESRKVLAVMSAEMTDVPSPIAFSKVSEITKKIQQQEGIKGKALYHPLRLALTGKESGIELNDFIPIIETGSTLAIKPAIHNMNARLKVFN
ncbi:MAG: glutamate--tRNA ligase [Acidobacteria bacterium]|jgi:glutamyl-tRNA synthetase/nondiscriminating glutamyl-tRNA synthetase|nr:glutamate--tRNA ligase [Acidobacteriota bacterium]